MRILTIAVISGIGLLAAPLAFAEDAKPVATPVSTTTATSDPVICHGIVHEGMIVHRSECHTQREWDRIRYQDQQQFRQFQQRSLGITPE